MLSARTGDKLRAISEVARKGRRVKDLRRLMNHPDLWMEAYPTSREIREPSHEVQRQQRWMVTHQRGRQISSNSSERNDISRTQCEESIYQQRLPEKCDPWAFHPPTINKYRKYFA